MAAGGSTKLDEPYLLQVRDSRFSSDRRYNRQMLYNDRSQPQQRFLSTDGSLRAYVDSASGDFKHFERREVSYFLSAIVSDNKIAGLTRTLAMKELSICFDPHLGRWMMAVLRKAPQERGNSVLIRSAKSLARDNNDVFTPTEADYFQLITQKMDVNVKRACDMYDAASSFLDDDVLSWEDCPSVVAERHWASFPTSSPESPLAELGAQRAPVAELTIGGASESDDRDPAEDK